MYIHALVNTMTFLCSCRNTGGYIYITCFVWLKVTTSSIHVSLISNNLFVFDGTLIVIGLVLDICLCVKSWHGPKCHSLSSFSYCKEYLYVRNDTVFNYYKYYMTKLQTLREEKEDEEDRKK